MKKEIAKPELLKLGFKVNNKIINGFKPHFINEKEDVVFLMGKDFWISKISDINTAFKDYGKNVFGIMLDDAPRVADKDWVTHEYVTLISVNPLAKGNGIVTEMILSTFRLRSAKLTANGPRLGDSGGNRSTDFRFCTTVA